MEYRLDRKEQYALIELKEEAFTEDVPAELEELVRSLFAEDYHNLILQMDATHDIDNGGAVVLRKINRLCSNNLGAFIVVTEDDDFIDKLEEAKIPDLEILYSVEEAIDAVFMHDLENEFGAGEDAYDEEDYASDED